MKLKHASFIALVILAVLASGCEKPVTAVKSEAVATVDGDKIGDGKSAIVAKEMAQPPQNLRQVRNMVQRHRHHRH